jgi:hypothetical protein
MKQNKLIYKFKSQNIVVTITSSIPQMKLTNWNNLETE